MGTTHGVFGDGRRGRVGVKGRRLGAGRGGVERGQPRCERCSRVSLPVGCRDNSRIT